MLSHYLREDMEMDHHVVTIYVTGHVIVEQRQGENSRRKRQLGRSPHLQSICFTPLPSVEAHQAT
jgi:hypothetical protein